MMGGRVEPVRVATMVCLLAFSGGWHGGAQYTAFSGFGRVGSWSGSLNPYSGLSLRVGASRTVDNHDSGRILRLRIHGHLPQFEFN